MTLRQLDALWRVHLEVSQRVSGPRRGSAHPQPGARWSVSELVSLAKSTRRR